MDDSDVHMKENASNKNDENYEGVVASTLTVTVNPSVSDGISSIVGGSTDMYGTSVIGRVMNTVSISDAEARKRPLSISSTSSSVSSSSSLPRRQHKKIATMVTLPSGGNIMTSLTGDQYCDLCNQHGQCPHKIQRTDALQSGQCSCAQSSKQGQLRHVCRVHGPAVDVSIAKSICNHSSTGPTKCSHMGNVNEFSELSDQKITQVCKRSTSNEARNCMLSSSNNLPGNDLSRSLSDPGSVTTCKTSHGCSHSVSCSHRCTCSYLSKVVQEIIETERVYVKDLRDIVQVM